MKPPCSLAVPHWMLFPGFSSCLGKLLPSCILKDLTFTWTRRTFTLIQQGWSYVLINWTPVILPVRKNVFCVFTYLHIYPPRFHLFFPWYHKTPRVGKESVFMTLTLTKQCLPSPAFSQCLLNHVLNWPDLEFHDPLHDHYYQRKKHLVIITQVHTHPKTRTIIKTSRTIKQPIWKWILFRWHLIFPSPQ